ncbi:phage minor tail protein G [Salmonella enterica subsp. enterica]|nr:phage minor tail protein G [Salmonella enterica subsp. enterica serovar Bonn]EDR2879486.1 phage minor tail protein G [Salmonella enterica subsp. enterica]EDV4985541.1 phage minor tail protein G [Salmonella enterica subsp. enterica]MLZ42060.1 phage minor tail protein G [Salmonella enterica subsp. enterica serovar Bonn]
MFLKSEPFERNGNTVTLYELSALQRIEHLEHLKALESITDADMQAAMDMTIKSGALLVAMSLWHGHPLKGTHKIPKEDVEQIQNEVLMTWPLEIISAAEYSVKSLSGMVPLPEANEPGDVAVTEPVSLEKSSPVS